MKDLKEVYQASSLENAENALERREQKWGKTARASVAVWRSSWQNISTFFQFPEDIRRMIYTTNAVEALHWQFRKVTKAKGAFPTDEALKKMLYLATLDMKGAMRSKRNWPRMLGQLKVVFEGRMPESAV